jgi:hypothetical protein
MGQVRQAGDVLLARAQDSAAYLSAPTRACSSWINERERQATRAYWQRYRLAKALAAAATSTPTT